MTNMRSRSAVFVLVLMACGPGGGVSFDLTPTPKVHEVPAAQPSTSPEVGVAMVITDAISTVDLDKEQNRRLIALVREIGEHHQHVQEMRKALALDIASSVESGNVDERALAADATNLGKARADVAADDGKSLEELHRVLMPEQRKRVATAILARVANLPTDDGQARYGNWRSDLEITVVQNEKIAPKLDGDTSSTTSARAERDAWAARLRATASEFARDTFSASSYLDPEVIKTTVERIRRVTSFLKLVVPELTEKQRQRAAENLRAEVGVGRD